MIKQSTLVRTTLYSLTRADLLAMLRTAVPGIVLPEDTEVTINAQNSPIGAIPIGDDSIVVEMKVKSVLEG